MRLIILTDIKQLCQQYIVCCFTRSSVRLFSYFSGQLLLIQWFKTMTTNEYIRGVKNHGWTPFHNKLWQRNYYEHIIRNDVEYRRIAEYIANNPIKWKDDKQWAK